MGAGGGRGGCAWSATAAATGRLRRRRARRARARSTSRPTAPRRARRTSPATEVERWLPAPAALPWWIPNAYILAVIAVGLAMIAFGVLRPRDRDRAVLGGQGPTTTPAAAGPRGRADGAGARRRAHPPTARRSGGGRGRERRTAAEGAGMTPKVPARRGPSSTRSPSSGASRSGCRRDGCAGSAAAPSSSGRPAQEAELRVFLEPGDEGPKTLSREAADFLAGRASRAPRSAGPSAFGSGTRTALRARRSAGRAARSGRRSSRRRATPICC